MLSCDCARATSRSVPLPAVRCGMRQRQDLPLVLDVGACDGELGLLAAQLEVVARDFGDDGHLGVVQVGHLAFELGVARLDAAAHAAEEVELPGGIEAGVVELRRCRGRRTGPPPPACAAWCSRRRR